MKTIVLALCSIFSLLLANVKADFAGPIMATNATSPDGNLLVRVMHDKEEKDDGKEWTYTVAYYKFDSEKDSYTRQTSFKLDGYQRR